MATLEEAINVIRDLVEGRSIEFEGATLEFTWAGRWKLPVWVAGYGPMALAMTGRVADGVILQMADPDLIRWFVATVRDAEVAAVDFAAAADAVQGVLPCSDGERQVLLVAASIAGGIPVDLREAALCMDAVNAARAARAICHAAGWPVVTETCR
jgi:hypothetical protein